MSVINQMLKDLEQRRAQGFDKDADMLGDLDASAAENSPVRSPHYLWLIFSIFFIVSILLAGMYSEGYFDKDEKKVEVETEIAQVVEPEKKPVHKSIVQEIIVKDDVTTKTEPPLLAEEITVEKEKTKPLQKEIKIATILPSPLYATGNREIITVYGSGFIAPLSVVMEWNDGRAFKELEGWQVNVMSETELQLHVNLGQTEDNWQLLVKQLDSNQQANYKFTALAKEPTPVAKETKPQEVVVEPVPESSFTKTNRILGHDEKVRLAFSKASLLIQQGKIKKAKHALHQVLVLDFSHLQARQALAAILFREQAYDEAIEVLELGSIQHPDHVPFTLLLARIYTERGQDPRAVELLERLQPAVAPNSEYYALLAALYQRGAQHKNAADVYKKLLVSFPSRAIWWMGLGMSLQALSKNEDALRAYNKSLQTQGLTAELRRFIKTRIAQLQG